jgi:Flp pilus assembly protein TadD
MRQSKGQLAEAITDYTKAIELKADYAEAYANRGVLRERKGDAAGAKADYSKSIELEIRGALEREYPGYKPPKG